MPRVLTGYLKEEMGLRYRKLQKVAIQANSQRNLILRQQYALTMLPLLQTSARIINIDETWISTTPN